MPLRHCIGRGSLGNGVAQLPEVLKGEFWRGGMTRVSEKAVRGVPGGRPGTDRELSVRLTAGELRTGMRLFGRRPGRHAVVSHPSEDRSLSQGKNVIVRGRFVER